MVPIARRNLLAEKPRFFVAVGGVAFAVFLIVLIQSLFLGFRQSAGALIEGLPFELWVVQDGTFDLYHSTSLLPGRYADRLAEVDGVASVQRVVGRQMRLKLGDDFHREFVFGFDRPVVLAKVAAGLPQPGEAPRELLEEENLPLPGRVIVSGSLADETGIEVGEPLRIGERQFTVAGMTGEDGGFRHFSFLNYDDARLLFGLNSNVNYITVALDEGAEPQEVAAEIDSLLPGVDVVDRRAFAERSRADISVFTPVLAVMMTIGFVVGAAVISLTIYTATIEKARDFGVMKALGATPWYLYRLVTFQSLAVGFGGFAVGVPLAVGAARATGLIVPEFVTLFQPQAIIGVLGVVVLMSLAAAYLPIHRISRIDPALVFRA